MNKYEAYKKLVSFNWFNISPENKNYIGKSKCGPENCPRLAKIIPEFVFTEACIKHDMCYFMGGTNKHRKFADKLFYEEMCKAIDKECETIEDDVYWLRLWYYGWAWIYKNVVSIAGKKSFEKRDHPLLAWELTEALALKRKEEGVC